MVRPSFANFFRKIFGRKTGTVIKRHPSRKLHVELLEDRVTPSTVVTTALDVVDENDDLTSLREAVTFANSNADASVITFGDGSAITGGTNFTDAAPDTILLSGGQMTITESATITGSGANRLTLDAAQASRIFEVASGQTVDIAGMSLTNGFSDGGGAILNFGTLTVTGCWIHDNRAVKEIGGGFGGGILSYGSLTVIGTTVSGNSTDNGGGINVGGGGIDDTSHVYFLTLINTTITGNGAFNGGGVFMANATLTMTNTTISGNGGNHSDFHLFVTDATVKNSILSDFGGFASPITDAGGNLFSVDPQLAPLGNYGGPMPTRPPLANSPAINGGINELVPVDLLTDQRGAPRIVLGTVDVGAVEYDSFDFGDAPSGYPVTFAEDGARHFTAGPTLGATRDSEHEGTHSTNANADGADEDGVTADGPLVVGQTTNITINVSASGFVNAWVDLNRDGDFDDVLFGEQFLTNFAVVAGDNVIPFAIPANYTPGPSVSRYRLTSASVDSPTPTGLLPDGEVEDYVGEILGFDFGDAPTGYPVTLGENGARHVDFGPTLGDSRDSETDGTHSALSDFDDLNGTAFNDEDGVTSAGPLVVGQTTNITINVQGGDGFVSAWADLNRDGDWDDVLFGEQFLTNFPVSVGDNVIPFSVPAEFPIGYINVRYRLTSASVASPTPTGLLPDGEVEDYRGAIVPLPSLVVTTASDTVDPFDGLTSLREALAAAAYFAGNDEITFGDGSDIDGGTDFTDATPDTIVLSGQQIIIDLARTGTIQVHGPGASKLTISGNDQSRIFYVTGAGSSVLSLNGLTLAHGNTENEDESDGGAIYADARLYIGACVFSDNFSDDDGGALALHGEYENAIADSTFHDNSSSDDGGVIRLEEEATLTVYGSTFFDNHSEDDGGVIDNRGTTSFYNSTLAYNSAVYASGAINNRGTVYVVHSTIVGNRAYSEGDADEGTGGIRTDDSDSRAYLFNSIIAGNRKGAIGADAPADLSFTDADNESVDSSSANNIIGDANTAANLVNDVNGNIVGANVSTLFITDINGNPLLADNGGPTKTIALRTGSIAINRGNNALAIDKSGDPLEFDQRGDGFDRTVGSNVDIGAFELQPATVSLDFGDAPTGYPTTLAENGARHIATGPTLGATRTSEAGGTHSADASADSGDDGVTASGPLVVGQTTNITINVRGGSGFVNAWADLNRDGDFNDPGERFLTNLRVSVGNKVIPFAIPANFTPGQIVTRYRLTSASVATPSPAGLLPDGEVEDYVGTIYPAVKITTTNVANWTVNRPGYSQTIAITGGTGTLTFSIQSGALPTGLTLNPATGAITGKPTTAATSTFTIKVTDAVGAIATRKFTVKINAAPSVGNLSQTMWFNGASGFSGTLPITGGTSAFAINSITGLPAGLNAVINGNRIAFTGAPNLNISAPTIFYCSVTVKDAAGAISMLKTFALTVNPATRLIVGPIRRGT